jgi:alkylation response protein AidB-like acyl-CoA dehydrogenase
MDFNFSEEQQLLGDTVQRFIREHYTFEKRREVMKSADGWSRDIWNELTGLGLTSINVSEDAGGMGGGPVETMLVMNAIGQGLLLEPYLPTAIFAPALLKALNDESANTELLPVIAAGERIFVVAHQEAQARGEVIDVQLRAEKTSDGYVLDGVKNVITHANAADDFLVSARTAVARAIAKGSASSVSTRRPPASSCGHT